MAWSGGVFTRTNGTYSGASVWASDQSASISIVPSRHDTHDLDLATGINQCVNKDGSNATGIITSTWLHADAASRSTLLIQSANVSLPTGTNAAADLYIYAGLGVLGFNIAKITMPKAGKVTHLSINMLANVTAGSLTAILYKNGATTGKALAVTSGSDDTGAIAAESFSAGDEISIAFSTNGVTYSASNMMLVSAWGHFTA